MRTKTTKANFDYFEKRVNFWLREFGQLDWSVHFSHYDLEDYAAQVRYSFSERGATFTMSKFIRAKITKKYIDYLALHEVVHLLSAHLEHLAGNRFISDREIEIAKEELTCIITSVVSKFYQKR